MVKKKTKNQMLASKRNWTKGRIVGMVGGFDRKVMTSKENKLFDQIRKIRDKLLKDWDKTKISDL